MLDKKKAALFGGFLFLRIRLEKQSCLRPA